MSDPNNAIVLEAYREADAWGKKFGDDCIPGFIRARICQLEQETKEPKYAKRGTASRIIPRSGR